MIPDDRPLIEVFAEIPDFRKASGKRHSLPSILALACCAVLCGYRSYSAIAEWGHTYGARFTRLLGFRGKTSSASTLHTIFKGRDVEVFETKLGAWAQDITAVHSPACETGLEATAIDGKTLRGSKKQGAPACTCSRPCRIRSG